MVRFDPADGNRPNQTTVKTGTLASPPERNPQRDGFRFDGWMLDGQPYDFQTPVLQNTTLKAQWSKTTDWTLSPDHGPASGTRLAISPPDSQEPYYITIQATGEQFLGLTGDGSIYTWSQEGTPAQIPSPAQAPQGFRYLQATTTGHLQAALGSDQRIYTWNRGQTEPVILNTDRNTGFTSIKMNHNRLLAVDRQGHVHTYQASQADSQDQTPEFTQKATASLPGQAQAVTAAASDKRILILDADGQAWTWETSSTGKAEPERVKQGQGTRIIQAQALSKGFLLLYGDGQTRYLNESTTSSATISLPDGVQASRITANKDQAIITGTDGRLWAWKPGEAPKRADDGSQQYMQAAEADGRITAIGAKGAMFTWNVDAQGKPGKPSRLDTTQAPTLESASLDGQALTLTKTGDAWQTQAPAHKPGPATITLAGRQDSQPFAKNLNYTVDQTLTRNAERSSAFTVHFDAGEGSPKPADQNVSTPYGMAKRPSPDPARQGYQFDGWFTGQVAYDFSKPVTQNLTLTAHWTPESRNNTWSINPDKGSQLGNEATTITPADTTNGIRFNQVSGSKDNYSGFSLAVGSDGNAYAWGANRYGQLGDRTGTSYRHTPVMVRKPAGVSSDFTYVQVSAGGQHSLALGSDGYVYAWGWNYYGQLGNNTDTDSSVPVRVRDPASPTDASKGLKATQVSAGSDHSLALGSNGYVYAWGNNSSGQLGSNIYSNFSSVPVRVRDPASPADASKGLHATQVSAGYSYSLALGSDGYAYAWGDNMYGQLGNNTSGYGTGSTVPVPVRDPASPTDASMGLKAVQVSAGSRHSLALGSDGYAYGWGENNYGQLGNNTTKDSSIPVPVRDPASPTDASKGLKATQVSGGGYHSLASDADGNTWAWGENNHGQLGNNTTKDSSVPVPVRDPASPTDINKGLKATQVSSGYRYSMTVGSDGYAYGWGTNDSSQLGDGTTNDSNAPVHVALNPQPMIIGVKFDQTAISDLKRGDGNSVTVTTLAHEPGTVTVSVDYTLGGAGSTLTYNNLQYTYTPIAPPGVLPRAGGEGILLALTTGMTGMGGVLASRRHRREQLQLLHASHE